MHSRSRQYRHGNLFGLIFVHANPSHAFLAALVLLFTKGRVFSTALRVPLALAFPCALQYTVSIRTILLVMLVISVDNKEAPAFRAFASTFVSHKNYSLQSFFCSFANAAKKNEAETGEEYGNQRKKRIFSLEIREEY